ncbi:helix-turn-helix domain-containing protein [Enterobacter cancerogenus]
MKKSVYIFTDNQMFFFALIALCDSYPRLQSEFEFHRISSDEIKKWLQNNMINESLIMAGPDMVSLLRFICIQNGSQCLQPYFRPEEVQKIFSGKPSTRKREKYILTTCETKALRPTKHELEIFACYLRGLTLYQIANYYGVSIKTISNHKRNLMKKLQVNSDINLYKVGRNYWQYNIANKMIFDMNTKIESSMARHIDDKAIMIT